MSEYEQVIDEIVKHGVAVKVNKIVDDNYIPYERKYVGCVVELDFSEHDKVFEDKVAEQKNEISMLKSLIDNYRDAESKLFDENKKLKQCIAESEDKISELEKEVASYKQAFDDKCKDCDSISELLNKFAADNDLLEQKISELESKKSGTCDKQHKTSDSAPSMEWYDNRHQSDCIEINRLNTTIDVLIHKVEYLRQFAGLE